MSLQRQLLTILFSLLSAFFLFKAGFLTIQHFVIVTNATPFYAYAKTDSQNVKTEASASSEVIPNRLIISDHQINLPISKSSVENGEWQVSTQGVSLMSPANPSIEQGFVLFGHDWPVLLGRIRQAKIGQQIELQYNNGKQETYRIESIFSISPTQLDILKLAKPKTILIYTCSGFLDSKRFVVLAQLQE